MSRVREFHIRFEQPAPSYPTPLSLDRARFRMRLITEEYKEVEEDFNKLIAATRTGARLPEQLDIMRALLKELADMRYVIEGAAVEMGLDIEAAFCEVHRSNMSKEKDPSDPKVRKGPNYSPADMTPFVPHIINIEEDACPASGPIKT